jgi:hypothetical protein
MGVALPDQTTGGGGSCWWHGAECGGGGGTEPAKRRALLLRAAGRSWRSRSQPATDPAVRKHGANPPPLSPSDRRPACVVHHSHACGLRAAGMAPLPSLKPSCISQPDGGVAPRFSAPFSPPHPVLWADTGACHHGILWAPLGAAGLARDTNSLPPLVTCLVGLQCRCCCCR